MLRGRKILLGVTGSIAAYKAAFLTRLFVQEGAEVKIIMTPAAHDFITPLTLATLSKSPVVSDFVASKEAGTWNNHVELGLWADLFIIAPASANTISAMANGTCNNLLLATYLSSRCEVCIAPAMDLDMYKHAATKKNLSTLKSFGVQIIQPGTGELASGLIGEGRMAEPEQILDFAKTWFAKKKVLSGKKVLITAGPTYEAIDPVRFIGNHSSGKMGIALAETALELGAEVILICGPSSESSSPAIKRINVTTAEEMFAAAKKNFLNTDISILSAAVADYRPKKKAAQKIKKKDQNLELELESTPDILKYLGTQKKKNQLLVGFALETENEVVNAKKKIKSKNLDFIVLNSLNDKGAGFGSETNKVKIIDKNNKILSFELKSKSQVAGDIFTTILKRKK